MPYGWDQRTETIPRRLSLSYWLVRYLRGLLLRVPDCGFRGLVVFLRVMWTRVSTSEVKVAFSNVTARIKNTGIFSGHRGILTGGDYIVKQS